MYPIHDMTAWTYKPAKDSVEPTPKPLNKGQTKYIQHKPPKEEDYLLQKIKGWVPNVSIFGGSTVGGSNSDVQYIVDYLNIYLFTENSFTLQFHWFQEILVSSTHQLQTQVEVITWEQTLSCVHVVQQLLNHLTTQVRKRHLRRGRCYIMYVQQNSADKRQINICPDQ